MKYKGILFDLDYFEGKSQSDLAELSDYLKTHDVKVGIVTSKLKTVWTWLNRPQN